MTRIAAVAAVALLAAVCGALIRRGSGEMAMLFTLAAAVGVFLFALTDVSALIETALGLASEAGMADALAVMLKALGIVLVGRLAVGVCKDTGEAALASGVEFAVKTAVLLISLPLLEELLRNVREVLAL